jgi:hypothetical protein
MAPQLSPTLLKILSSTVLEVERALKLPKSDPCLRDLKHTVLLALGELELKHAGTSRTKILWIKPDFAGRGDPVEREQRKDPKERSERGGHVAE